MKYLYKYKTFEDTSNFSENINYIKDILLELDDLDFKTSVSFSANRDKHGKYDNTSIVRIYIVKRNFIFIDVKDTLLTIKSYMGSEGWNISGLNIYEKNMMGTLKRLPIVGTGYGKLQPNLDVMKLIDIPESYMGFIQRIELEFEPIKNIVPDKTLESKYNFMDNIQYLDDIFLELNDVGFRTCFDVMSTPNGGTDIVRYNKFEQMGLGYQRKKGREIKQMKIYIWKYARIGSKGGGSDFLFDDVKEILLTVKSYMEYEGWCLSGLDIVNILTHHALWSDIPESHKGTIGQIQIYFKPDPNIGILGKIS